MVVNAAQNAAVAVLLMGQEIVVAMLPSELSLFLLPNWPRLPVGWKAHAINVYLVMVNQLDESLLPVVFTTDHIHEITQHHQGVINFS